MSESTFRVLKNITVRYLLCRDPFMAGREAIPFGASVTRILKLRNSFKFPRIEIFTEVTSELINVETCKRRSAKDEVEQYLTLISW